MTASWDQKTDKEKIEPLYQMCAILTQTIDQQRAWANSLQNRVKALEDRNRFSGR